MNTTETNKDFKKEVVEELAERLQSDYIFPDKAKETAELILGKLSNGEYEGVEDPFVFSNVLTEDLQKITRDRHLKVMYSTESKSIEKEKIEEEMLEEYRRKTKSINYGFYKVERLNGNIGYIDLRNFVDTQLGGETAVHAMNFIANTDALIFDLRKNGGGSPAMIALITSYLFEEVTHLNNFYYRPEGQTRQSWTLPYTPGQRYLNKPVYILTSHYTFSAAEEFTYNLKNLNRATVIGEVTGGGAHPGRVQQITEHFRVFIPTGRAVNPITNTNWEGTGVEPDIKVSKELAFDRAYNEALKYVKEKYKDKQEYQFLMEEIEEGLTK
ncbi:S41 family peptidase [Bacillus salitolerans]|uniref:S41 family peptidase n=1 Tax=Bacillus salitolerans TaxID=1437434 RepID=A0ABW4LPS8_9BACI